MPNSRCIIGRGEEYKNISSDKGREVFVRIGAFTVDDDLAVPSPEGTIEEPDFLPIKRSVPDGIKCLVDTGATTSTFRCEIARKLGLKPGDGQIDPQTIEDWRGIATDCCVSRHNIWLDIGPCPIRVVVEFPIKPMKTATGLKYRWCNKDDPEHNILGMESLLDRRVLCFTQDHLFVFENRP